MPLQHVQALGRGQVQFADQRVHRVDQPRVHAQQLGKLLGHLFVVLQVRVLAARRSRGVQRRQQVLLVQAAHQRRRAGREFVVEQDRAGVEVLQPEPPFGADQRLDRQAAAVGQRHLLGRFQRRVHRAQAHVDAGHRKDLHQPLQVHQVKSVAAVVGHNDKVLCFGADLLDRRHRRLHCQRQHRRRQVVEPGRVQVGVYRRQLEASVAQVDRRVERWRVLHPFEPEPALDGRHGLEHALFELVDGPGEGGDEMGDHGPILGSQRLRNGPFGQRVRSQRARGQAQRSADGRIQRHSAKPPKRHTQESRVVPGMPISAIRRPKKKASVWTPFGELSCRRQPVSSDEPR